MHEHGATPLRAWLAGLFITLAMPAQAASAILCRGEEPFWALEGDADRGVLATPEARTAFAGRLDSLDWLPPGWLVWHGPGLTATLRAEACSSTMAEGPAQSHRAILVTDVMAPAAGCCSVAPALPLAALATRPADDWTRLLPDLQPGIAACLAASGTPLPRVVTALPMNHGLMLARLATADGSRHDCIVEIGGGQRIDRIEPLPADAAGLPGEGAPVLFAEGGPLPPAGARLERILAADGSPVGWLARTE